MAAKKVDPWLKKMPACYKLPRWLLEWMRAHSKKTGRSIAELIEHAVASTYYASPDDRLVADKKQEAENET